MESQDRHQTPPGAPPNFNPPPEFLQDSQLSQPDIRRPLLRSSSSSMSSAVSGTSDGGDHLAEARERLIDGEEDVTSPADEEHSWDSVWPSSRSFQSDPGPSRLPLAPLSPYNTPSFSFTSSPRPNSPSRSPSPPRRRQSITSPSTHSPRTSPVQIRHQRTLSTESVSRGKARAQPEPVHRVRRPSVTSPGPPIEVDMPAHELPPLDDVPNTMLLPPPLNPLPDTTRPTTLRRAASDFEVRSRPSLHRGLSISSDDLKRTGGMADLHSPASPGPNTDPDSSRTKKSPRKSPRRSPNLLPVDPDLEIVDEGDVLPVLENFQMDVTFDDEGLNTLERIFLLSKSDYAFHRAYVARVLGDLLIDVDPCESVEYVLPLLSGFSVDEDDTVKEAFASELHRVLWYFYSRCTLLAEDYPPTVTVSSEGMELVPKQNIDFNRRTSVISLSGPSSAGSSLPNSHEATDTPGSTASSSSQDTAFSPSVYVNPFTDDHDPEKGWAKDVGPLMEQPSLAIGFFTPLLGSLLLSQNPAIADPVRNGVVSMIGRLRRKGTMEAWGADAELPEPDERRTFASQTGPHAHDLRPFPTAARTLVENELLHGIVFGMGQLATEMPEALFDTDDDEREAFQAQMVMEATMGRATSLNLIGAICEFYSAEETAAWGFVDEVLRSADGDIAVRAEAGVALSYLAKIASDDDVQAMIPLHNYFVSDEIDHVRQSACLSLPALCRRLPEEQRREFAIHSMSCLIDSSEDVRCAALEMLGEVIHSFIEEGPPMELLQIYMDEDDSGPDSDWDMVAAFNFPGVCLTLGADRWPELRNLFLHLQSRAGDRVLRTTASSLHELAKILHPQQVVDDIIPVYKRCLQGDDDLRERIYENVDTIFKRMPQDDAWILFCDLSNSWKSGKLGGWRARERLAKHMSAFMEVFPSGTRLQAVLDMLHAALLDPFAAVRTAATDDIPKAYKILSTQSAHLFRKTLLELGASPSYRQRITFIRCLRAFIKPPPNKDAFEEFFLPVLNRIKLDVIDVRIALAQTVADMFVTGAFYDTGAPEIVMDLVAALKKDDAVDVRDIVRSVRGSEGGSVSKDLSSLQLGEDPFENSFIRSI